MDYSKKVNIQVSPHHYFSVSYDMKERFISYWHQINEIVILKPSEVLEIGIGNNFVSSYLKERGFRIITLDLDGRLGPDVIGDLMAIPFAEHSFQVVTCYELLEHLPYNYFLKVMRELINIARSHVILSLPDVTTVYRFHIELPRLKPIKKMIDHPFPRPSVHQYDGQHYWEIGKRDYPLKRIEYDIKQAGFKIIKSYRIFEFPYHRFFLLSCF
jgi:hypothetical protein